MNDISYTAVIVAYHRPASLAALLKRLTHGPGRSPQIVVVNVDRDGEVRAIVARYADVTEIPVTNRGYAAAVNVGAAAARHAITVFMNDDLCLARTDLHALVARIASGATDAAVPRVVDAAGADEGTIRALPTPGRLLVEWALTPDAPHRPRAGVQKWRRPVHPEAVPAVVGALVAVRTELLLQLPLPEEYFLYWEDVAWSWHLRRAGARVEINPSVTVEHAGGRDDLRPDKQRLLARNAVRCVRQTQGRWAAAVAWPIVVLWQFRLVVVEGFRFTRHAERRAQLATRGAGLRAAVSAWREIA